ncbi:hypothetical protein CHH83_02120 [Bacillus sp. 7586-K]|nr:hypothetical protein CHH83_02120 [Bacillus sp. 7586-K]
MRKRYWLFTWDTYYPGGGTSQVEFKFDTIEELKEWIKDKGYFDEWAEILDLDKGETYFSSKSVSDKESFEKWIESVNIWESQL